MTARMPVRRLGAAGPEVSALSLGSWRTFERIDRSRGLAVMEAARTAGIDFLDDARYDDETGSAPIPTGYSEVVFGELFARSGYQREQVVVANKLWWEFWPDQDAAAEVDASLERMGLDRLDLIYSAPVPEGLEIERVVDEVAGLLDTGRARFWGVVNWPGEMLEAAAERCSVVGCPQPCCAQLPYNLASREWVEGPPMRRALERSGASVVASAVLAGGALSGKYLAGGSGRLSGPAGRATITATEEIAAELSVLAAEWGSTPANLALAFALSQPLVASVLFGATAPEQVEENCGALALLDSLDPAALGRLSSIGGGPPAAAGP
jgi:aryl-alcohol dehydrogenase-like predicted oxidoreductase